MWDNHRALSKIANALFALAGLLILYGLINFVVHLEEFSVRQVKVVGNLHNVTSQQIETVVHRELKGNFFTMDLIATKVAFEKLPWVRSANLRRQWPDRIDVSLEEHQALARLRDSALVNNHGEVFDAASDTVLPVFFAPLDYVKDITQHYLKFREQLGGIGLEQKQIKVNARGAWEIHLGNDMVLELGRERIDERMARFVAVYPVSITIMPEPVSYVDLRYANGFSVRVPGLAPQNAKT